MDEDDQDLDCPSCGATPGDRRSNMPGGYLGLHTCNRCTAGKCCMCDMGDDVECLSCDDNDD